MASSEDPTQNQQFPDISLSLPELLTLLFLEKRDVAPQIQGYVLRESPLLAPATVLALILDLGLQKFITLKLKSTWIRGDRMVINLADAKGSSTQNEALDLMIDRLKNQKHDHSVQQWADHWCGKTFRELLFPTHPTEELRRVVLNKLSTRGIISWKTISNGELVGTPSPSPTASVQPIVHLESEGQAVVNQVRKLLVKLLIVETDNSVSPAAFDSTHYLDNMNHIDVRLLLLASLCPNDIAELILLDPQQKTACRKTLDGIIAQLLDRGQDSKSILSEDVKTILDDIRNYLMSVKLLQ